MRSERSISESRSQSSSCDESLHRITTSGFLFPSYVPIKQLTLNQLPGRFVRSRNKGVDSHCQGASQADSANSICFGGRRWDAYLRRHGTRELVGPSRIIGSHDHTRFETQRRLRNRLYHHPVGAKTSGCNEDGHADVLRYQVSRLLSCNEACAPSRLISRWFWIATSTKRKASAPPTYPRDACNMVATPDRRLYLACSGVNKVAVVDLNK
jgi:hypothetical protein